MYGGAEMCGGVQMSSGAQRPVVRKCPIRGAQMSGAKSCGAQMSGGAIGRHSLKHQGVPKKLLRWVRFSAPEGSKRGGQGVKMSAFHCIFEQFKTNF